MLLLLPLLQDDAIVIHFQSEQKRINAYTLASTLVAIADAAKAANAALNPGYDIEVVVEAIGPGSFRTKIKAGDLNGDAASFCGPERERS